MSRNKSLTTIKDPLLEPFFITCDRHGYTLHEIVSSDGNHRLSKGTPKEYSKVVCYPRGLDGCLNYILKQRLQTGEDFNSLKEVLDTLNETYEKLKKYIDANKGKV